jgi:hypothetical protein
LMEKGSLSAPLFFFVISITQYSLKLWYLCCQNTIMGTIRLTTEKFKEDVFDYTKSQDWEFKGDVPVIIDFYADW